MLLYFFEKKKKNPVLYYTESLHSSIQGSSLKKFPPTPSYLLTSSSPRTFFPLFFLITLNPAFHMSANALSSP